MESEQPGGPERRLRVRQVLWVPAVLILVAAGLVGWLYRDHLRSPAALYREAQTARPERAAVLYTRLAERLPQIEEYARLWAAGIAMPDLEALRTLQAIAAFRPSSPAAYQAHVDLARYYARIEAPEAEGEYRAALALQDSVALRLELAYHLEEKGDDAGAYAEHLHLLGQRPDAFDGMRRTGEDPLAVAQDLNAAYYYSDALETLRGTEDPRALPVMAEALSGLDRHREAEVAYRAWLRETPDDSAAELGLARVLMALDHPGAALTHMRRVDTADGQLAQAELLHDRDPERALALYLDSPYPTAWWSATELLEGQGRITETLPLYVRVAQTYSYLSDDAAYRLYVLARRLDDQDAQAQGEALLKGLGLNWLAQRAGVRELEPAVALPLSREDGGILAKVQALEAIGREDLAHMELTFAAQARRAPEVDLAMAEALASRGYLLDAQAVAEPYTRDRPQAALEFWKLSYPQPYSTTVEAMAAEFDLDPLLIWAMMREESRYDPEALSYVGARGLMQVMPTTQDWIAEEWGEQIAPGEAFMPEANIRMGAWFLRYLLDYFDGDLELALAAYNGGAGSVDNWQADPRVSTRDDLLRWIGFGETREYLERVMLSYEIYQRLYTADGSGDTGA